MKAISLTQPWATACVHRWLDSGPVIKAIETRSWASAYRGQLLIHAAKAFPEGPRYFANEMILQGAIPRTLPLGVIIGIVQMVDCLPTEQLVAEALISATEMEWGDYSPGRFGFVFKDATAFEQSLPCRGALGIWNVPSDIAAQLPIPNATRRA